MTASQVLRRTDVAATQNLDEVGFRLPGVGGATLDAVGNAPDDLAGPTSAPGG